MACARTRGPAALLGQPIVQAVAGVTPVLYAETVTVVAAAHMERELRDGLDELVEGTAHALELAGAARAKSIYVVSPAEPPVPTRTTIHVVTAGTLPRMAVASALEGCLRTAHAEIPGLRLVPHQPWFEECRTPWGVRPAVVLSAEIDGAEAMCAAAVAVGGQPAAHTAEPVREGAA